MEIEPLHEYETNSARVSERHCVQDMAAYLLKQFNN